MMIKGREDMKGGLDVMEIYDRKKKDLQYVCK